MIEKSDLPEGWCISRISDIAVKGEQRTPGSSELFIYVDIGSINRDLKSIESPQHLLGENAPSRARKVIKAGDVLVSLTRPNLNAVALVPELFDNQIASTGFEVIKPFIVENRYVFALTRSKHFIDAISGAVQGALYPAAKSSDVQGFEFPLPPLAEQKVIADKLDFMLTKVEITKARLEHIPEILKRFRQSVLTNAVTGKLTEQWRSKYGKGHGRDVIQNDTIEKLNLLNLIPSLAKKKSSLECAIDSEYIFDLPDSWDFSTWGKVSEWITYGFTRPMPKSDSGVKLLTAKDIQYFQVNIDEAGLTTPIAFGSLSDKDRPTKGDLLITKDGSIGRAALVRTDESFCINQSVAVCWLRSTTMNKDFLEYLANSEFTQKFVKDKAQGMAIQHLSIIDYAKCPLPVPPLDEQVEIVRRIEQLFALADNIEQKANAALARVNNLTQSILAKAFRGELTADWRAANPDLISGDNSAEALLTKIKTERAKLSQTKKGRGKSFEN